ncbi:hypothetical protein cypCar_00048043, partial [Cyprinus carpio]
VCCRDFSISLPQNIQALSGSCVIIKCRFEIQEQYDKDLTERATGLWLKDGDKMNDHLVFHSTDPKPNHFNGKIPGNLHEKNCTTIFYNVSSEHTGRYYFRIESGGLKYFYTVNTSIINVLDYQQATVPLLIILTLILVLFALTVGLALYKIRQLSSKLKAQNEAAGTYASLQLSAPPSEYETLNIKRSIIFGTYLCKNICIFFLKIKGVCCRDFNISLPQNIQALNGSCVIIKCRFEIHEQYDKNLTESAAKGLWFKDGDKTNDHLVLNSTDPQPSRFNGKITGNLHEKNCTTIFYNVSSKHTGRYYFRIESGGLKYFYTMNTSINVTGE